MTLIVDGQEESLHLTLNAIREVISSRSTGPRRTLDACRIYNDIIITNELYYLHPRNPVSNSCEPPGGRLWYTFIFIPFITDKSTLEIVQVITR